MEAAGSLGKAEPINEDLLIKESMAIRAVPYLFPRENVGDTGKDI